MSKQSLFSLDDSGKSFIVLGTPRKGKSIGEEFAKNNPNIVFVDVSEEERAARKEQSKLKEEAEKNRLLAVKESYWLHSKDDEGTMDFLKYLLLATFDFGETEPTHEQLKALFMYFDDYIIGNIISWGITDTEVRQSIYEYIDERKIELESAIYPANN
ncbi:hypothetical protein [Acinetobacter sp. HZNU-JH01]|uniref:hypothetical protein n=1 Tax=Acinetobacter sp. HZNU-JH01 TaxID=3136280 RepID=UPI0030F42C9F